MNKEEAFRQWINNTQGKGLTYQEMWDAACAWQKEQDAEICQYADVEYQSTTPAGAAMTCARVIRAQP